MSYNNVNVLPVPLTEKGIQMRNLKTILLGIIFGFGILSSSGLAAAKLMGLSPQVSEKAEQAKNLIVMVRGRGRLGAGIIFNISDDRLLIATAYHVVVNGVEWVNFRFLESIDHINAVLVYSNKSLDLAVLRVDLQKQNDKVRNMLTTFVRFDKVCYCSEFKRGDEVNVVLENWHVPTTRPRINNVIADEINVDYACSSGDSGGAIFNESWDLIGMIRRTDLRTCMALSFKRIVTTLVYQWRLRVDLKEHTPGIIDDESEIKNMAEQATEPPLFYKKVGFNFSLGYSRLSMDPNPPRDFQIHANHPDDEFLTGSPGSTDLDYIQLDSLELEIGPSFRLGKRNMALFALYVAKIPFSKVGREERQQENDPRPPSEGSYIYTKLADANIGHIFRSGLGVAFRISEYQNFWLEIRCLFDVGKWDMDFDKGWSRYGRDESEWRSEASGFFFSPKGKISLSMDRWSIFFSVGSAQISFDHPHPNLEAHRGKGYEISLGGRFIL